MNYNPAGPFAHALFNWDRWKGGKEIRSGMVTLRTVSDEIDIYTGPDPIRFSDREYKGMKKVYPC